MRGSVLRRWLAISGGVHLALLLSMGTAWRPPAASVPQPSAAVLIVTLTDEPVRASPSELAPNRSLKRTTALSARTPPQAAPEPPAADRVGAAVADQAAVPMPDTSTSPAVAASEAVEPPPAAVPDEPAGGEAASSTLPVPRDGRPSEDNVALDRYRALVLSILERTKRYPLLARRRELQGTVEIAFTIDDRGRVSNPELVASSHHAVLDDAAMAMTNRLGFLPPPPAAPLRFSARIEYRLESLASPISTEGVNP